MLVEPNLQHEPLTTNTCSQPVVALLVWGEVWEDFLGELGISLESFCNDIPFGWMSGYINALRLLGVKTILICPSARFTQPTYFTHQPSGAVICMLPVPKIYLALRRKLTDMKESPLFGQATGIYTLNKLLYKVLREAAPYLCTSVSLLAQELRQQNCQVILCQDYEYFRFDVCVILGKLLQLPVFATFQGTLSENWFGRWLRPLTIRNCTGLIAGSQAEIQRAEKRYNLPSAKITRIFNPLDLQFWSASDRQTARAVFGVPSDAEVAVWHGRVEIGQKGLDILFDAWEHVCKERAHRNLKLLLMGTGNDAEKVRQRIAALPQQNVIWLDQYTTDRTVLRDFLSAGDVYVFPSRHEGFPVAPLEAMACSLPLVAANAPGIADIFEDGENSGGLVVPVNDPVTFAQALGRILDDDNLRQNLGKNARHRVEKNFSLEIVGQQLRKTLLAKKS